MTRTQQKQSFDAFAAKQWETMDSKAQDYAGDDRLSNFKQVGSITGQTAAQACLTLIATKVARLSQLLGGKSPKNESIQDSVLDLGTYASLLNMLLEEENSLFCKQVDINKNKYPDPKLLELSSYTDFLKSRRPTTASEYLKGLQQLQETQKMGQGLSNCPTKDTVLPKAKLKKKVKTYKAEDGVTTFTAKNMKDALKQLEATGITVPNGMMLGCMQVK